MPMNGTKRHVGPASITTVARARCADSASRRRGVDLGKDFIHVHHLKEITSIGEECEMDSGNDLIPVCPNCHAMLHRRRPALMLEALASIWQDRKSE